MVGTLGVGDPVRLDPFGAGPRPPTEGVSPRWCALETEVPPALAEVTLDTVVGRVQVPEGVDDGGVHALLLVRRREVVHATGVLESQEGPPRRTVVPSSFPVSQSSLGAVTGVPWARMVTTRPGRRGGVHDEGRVRRRSPS